MPIKFGKDLKYKFLFTHTLSLSFLLDVEVDVPDALDLSSLRGKGIQPGEEELPDETASKQSDDDEGIENSHRTVKFLKLFLVEIDEEVLSQLAGMGFDIEGCKRAIYHTKNQGRFPYSRTPERE